MLPFVDISQWQGRYPMAEDKGPMVMMKASGSDTGSDYLDPELDTNYADAKNADKIPFMYHLPGDLNPISEAHYYFNAISPLAVGDGYALDIEPTNNWGPDEVAQFIQAFWELTHTYPWVYADISRVQSGIFSKVPNCGLWLAAPSYLFSQNVPNVPTYIAQQGPAVNNVDQDMFFGTLEELKAYTLQSTKIIVPSTPTPTPVVSTSPPAQTTAEPAKPVETVSTQPTSPLGKLGNATLPPSTTPKPAVSNEPKPSQLPTITHPVVKLNWWQRFLKWLMSLF